MIIPIGVDCGMANFCKKYNLRNASLPIDWTVSYNGVSKCIEDDFKNFIHLVYIECARAFYNTPFLFSHRDSPIDIKRNQTEILKNIQGGKKDETFLNFFKKIIYQNNMNNSNKINYMKASESKKYYQQNKGTKVPL